MHGLNNPVIIGDFRKTVLYIGIFLVMPDSFRQRIYKFWIFRLWSGREDFFKSRRRRTDFARIISVVRIPDNQITNRNQPINVVVWWSTESVKSSIQALLTVGLSFIAFFIVCFVLERGDMLRFWNHNIIWGSLKRRNGKKGTAKRPSSKNQRWYCMWLDRLFLNRRLARRRMPMILQRNKLQMPNRIIKSVMVDSSYSFFCERSARSVSSSASDKRSFST